MCVCLSVNLRTCLRCACETPQFILRIPVRGGGQKTMITIEMFSLDDSVIPTAGEKENQAGRRVRDRASIEHTFSGLPAPYWDLIVI